MTDPKMHLKHFNREFSIVLKRKHPEAIAIFAHITSRLRQFKLQDQYDAYYVLSEVYIRGVKCINDDKPIRIPHAFIRFVSLRVIQELNRQRQRHLIVYEYFDSVKAEKELSRQDQSEPSLSHHLDAELDKMHSAFQTLGRRDQEILILRYQKGLSWEDVSESLVDVCGAKPNTTTIRQAGHRALKRLRNIMSSL